MGQVWDKVGLGQAAAPAGMQERTNCGWVMLGWVEVLPSMSKDSGLRMGLVGELWGLQLPLLSTRAGAVGRHGWAKLQHPAACMWDGSGSKPSWAGLQHLLVLTRARMDVGKVRLGHGIHQCHPTAEYEGEPG